MFRKEAWRLKMLVGEEVYSLACSYMKTCPGGWTETLDAWNALETAIVDPMIDPHDLTEAVRVLNPEIVHFQRRYRANSRP